MVTFNPGVGVNPAVVGYATPGVEGVEKTFHC